MPGTAPFPCFRRFRLTWQLPGQLPSRLLGAVLSVPLLAVAAPSTRLDIQLEQTREMVRFVPDDAVQRLRGLEAQARSAPVATHAEFLSLYSSAVRRAGDSARGLALAEELVAYGRAQHDDVALAKGLLTRTYSLFALNQLAAARASAFEAERVARFTTDLPLRVQTMITAGQSFQEQGNYPAALAKLQAATDLSRRIADDKVPLASALNALVQLYTDMRQYEKGWETQQESVAVARTMASPGRLAIALSTEYGLAIDSEQPARARHALLDGLAVERRLGARQMIAKTLVNLSDSYLKDGNNVRALDYADQALKAATAVQSNTDAAIARVNLGQAYLGLGRTAEGKKQFEAGLVEYEKSGNKPDMQRLLVEYGAALERAGDHAAAIAAYHRERALSNELFAEQSRKAVLELQQKYDTEKNQQQMEALRQENRAKGAELDNRRLQQKIWWLLAVVTALVAVIVGLLYRKVRQANAQLEEKNLELKQQSVLDPLTALYNRRHFQEFMRHHALVERRAAPADDDLVGALFLLDVDHFKHVNDTYGHAAGDAVLRMIAENLRIALRETDMIVRWGGEEFLAFLPSVTRDGVDDVARRILHCISSQSLEYQGTRIQVNVSVGFAPFPLVPGDTPLSWERAVNLVDMALYLAKSHGRNRAYGVRGFANFAQTSMEAIEQNLEMAWRNGFVDLSIVLGDEDTPPDGGWDNVVALAKTGN